MNYFQSVTTFDLPAVSKKKKKKKKKRINRENSIFVVTCISYLFN